MTATATTDLERALQRHGDDLYRLALLLAPDEHHAARALLVATRRVATGDAAPDEHILIAALLDALPPEPQRWRPLRLPPWAAPPAPRSAIGPLLGAIARLPRRQRLVLGLTLLRGFDAAQATPLLGGDEAAVREQIRDALLALAPRAAPDLAPADLIGADAPEACRPTRAALALGGAALHADPAVRGHLALCAACRAAEQGWLRLTTIVEEALRGALRDVRLPDELAERLSAAGAPQSPTARERLADPRLRVALVALLVLALIALLVFPRGARNAPPSGELAAAPPSDPRELIRRASEYLYTPPPGAGAWHARYAIQWAFAGGTQALLAADQWIEPASGRHRLQLTHHDGGGPYEFELGDGTATAWYAVGPIYAPSLYPLSVDMPVPPAQIQATPDEQQRMLQARLQSGAWDLPAAYLRQAQAATTLQTWGRQRDADGAILSLIGFSGVSPLAPPPDAADANAGPITILLALDEASGRLRELRELVGPAGGEQITRTIWRVESEEWITDPAAITRAFDPKQAWNGVGTFSARGRMADPALPLVEPERVAPLAIAVQRSWTGLWMPARSPPGATSALLVNRVAAPIRSDSYDEQERLTFVYLGAGRRLELFTARGYARLPTSGAGGEVRTLNGQQLLLKAAGAQSYQAQITHLPPFGGDALVTQVSARGYTRAELLDFLQSLGPPTLDDYRAQAQLFADQYPHDAAFETLLGALDPPPAPVASAARHIVERLFSRYDPAPDPLADPYHQPRYNGFPERLVQETWTRGTAVNGTREAASSTHDTGGALLGRSYVRKELSWYYNAPLSQIDQFVGAAMIDSDIWPIQGYGTILNMIGCGQAKLSSNPDSTRTVVLSDSHWREDSCQHPRYSQFLRAQTAGDFTAGDNAPYLADLSEQDVTTWVDLDTSGRLLRVEVRAGPIKEGPLLEAWELERDEQLPPDRVPAAAFDPAPPDALVRWSNSTLPFNLDSSSTRTVALTEALALARTPLFGLAPAGSAPVAGSGALTSTTTLTATLAYVNAGTPPPAGPIHLFISDEEALQGAMRDGYAVQLTYSINAPLDWPILNLYEGPASTFGAYLHATAHWATSAPVMLQVGDRTIAGWQVGAPAGDKSWTLFELDGTLIAVEYPPDKAPAVIAELRRIAAP